MKERPILFKAEMVKAILDGTKRQTRRIVGDNPIWDAKNHGDNPAAPHHYGDFSTIKPCPQGKVGDRLWVKETWGTSPHLDHIKPTSLRAGVPIQWAAGGTSVSGFDKILPPPTRWRPSLFLTRELSRITLEITGVRVERLQDISEADAKAEGTSLDGPVGYIPARQAAPYTYHYAQLWESINGAGSWAKNPWVWVIEFKKIIQ